MNRVLYEVTATVHDRTIADEWVRWIVQEHMGEMRDAGAVSSRLIRIDHSASSYVVQYEFASRAALDHYLAMHAPRLRAAGEEHFEPQQISYTRRTGEILGSLEESRPPRPH